MNATDERLERYLHDRSTTIDLPHAGIEVITRRARRHRRRRSAVVGGAMAAVLLGGTAVVIGGQPDGQEEVGSLGASVVDSPLEWSIAPVRTGLGWSSATVSDGSAVYSLSTAPGAEGEATGPVAPRLYRSEDGTDWEGVALPDGLSAAALGASDGSVYAVGTAAAGGDTVGVELATSSDGGAGWDTSPVPLDVAGLAAGFPGRVRAVDAEVAVSDGTTVVAVSVVGTVEVGRLLPDEPANTWFQDSGGLVRPERDCTAPGDEGAGASTTEPPTTAPAAPETAPPGAVAADGSAPDPAGGAERCVDDGSEPEQRSWADLGLTPEQASLADGETHLFVGAPGGDLELAETLPMGSFTEPSQNGLLAADDGFWLVRDQAVSADPASSTTEVTALHSVDGRSWAPAAVGTARGVLTVGVADGRPVVVTIGTGDAEAEAEGGYEQPVVVSRIESDGVVTPVDLNALVDIPTDAGIDAWAVGPLGVAVVMAAGSPDRTDDRVVLTSADGLGWSSRPLPDAEPGTSESVNGITVTPDAVKVRLNVREDGTDPAAPPSAQRLFVGTPTG